MKFTNHHISDVVTRIKNATLRGHSNVCVPNVGISKNLLEVLRQEGYIENYEIKGYGINVKLRYENEKSVIVEFNIVSKPSRRVYKKASEVPSYYNGLGVTVLSTSKGVMSDAQAYDAGVGGEVLCQVF